MGEIQTKKTSQANKTLRERNNKYLSFNDMAYLLIPILTA